MQDKPSSTQKHHRILGTKLEPQSHRTRLKERTSPSTTSSKRHQRLVHLYCGSLRPLGIASPMRTIGHTFPYPALTPPWMSPLKVRTYLLFNYPFNVNFRRPGPEKWRKQPQVTQHVRTRAKENRASGISYCTPESFAIFTLAQGLCVLPFLFLCNLLWIFLFFSSLEMGTACWSYKLMNADIILG